MKLDNLGFTGGEMVLRDPKPKTETTLEKLQNSYDEFAKLIFIFDISGSMITKLAGRFAEQYLWNDSDMARIRMAFASVINKVNAALAANIEPKTLLDSEEQKIFSCLIRKENGWGIPDDDELKSRVIEKGLAATFWLSLNPKCAHPVPSRLDVVKRLSTQEIKRRYEKYPKSSVAVILFASSTQVLFHDGNLDELYIALMGLKEGLGGGTRILEGIRTGMEVCRNSPSKVGIHHFIIVSDGEDGECEKEIGSWVPALRASGIVLDYIHIGDHHTNASLMKASVELGGTACVVEKEEDIETKFVEAVQRKMLPPPAE